MNHAALYGIILLVIVCALLVFRISNLESALENEKAAHELALADLVASNLRCEALAENARRCLAREAQSQAMAAERSAIFANAQQKERPREERIADEATRNAVIERLNRGFAREYCQ